MNERIYNFYQKKNCSGKYSEQSKYELILTSSFFKYLIKKLDRFIFNEIIIKKIEHVL
jgi:hypothetical protein